MASSLVGSTLGRFRVDRLLGRGGMGEVYAAFDERLEREVALKVLNEEGDLLAQKKRLMREARMAAKLTHPNIATIFEVDELGERLYIVMELLEGSSLRRILTERKIEVHEAITIARDIARALARAHAGGVIHRDIKPENIFVTQPSPDTLLTKVLDFGLARQRPDAVTVAEQTYTATRGDMWGTPGYVSPEQAHGQPVDVRSDIFSFGVIFYEMLAGIKPFRAETPLAIMIATTRTEARPVREITPEVPPAIDELLRRCMRKDRAERFVDGAALSAALEGFVRTSPNPYAMSSVIGSSSGSSILPREPASGPAAGGTVTSRVPFDSDSRIVGGSAAASSGATRRAFDAPPLEQQRREHMRLVAAIGSGVATALVLVVVILAWLSPAPGAKLSSTSNALNASNTARAPAPAASDLPPVLVVSAPPPPAQAESSDTPLDVPESAESSAAGAGMGAGAGTAPAPSSAVVEAPSHPAARTAAGASSARGSRKKPADCVEPFKVDAKGVKIPKLYCL